MRFPEDISIRFKNFINNRTGLYFKDYDLKDIDNVIAQRMNACGFDTVIAYYTYLTVSEKREDELRELLNRLTINHTYFFRNEPQFKVLKEKILPEVMERKMQEALAVAKKEKPDLVILDLMLPKVDVYKVCAMLKFDKNFHNTPIIILTARAGEEDKKMGQEVCANVYIIKPVEPAILIAKIKELIKE